MEGVEKLSDLKPGMVLEGAVTNVAAFGAFVDIGVHQDGLVHISAMSKTFIKDPREVVKPGDIVSVKVLEVEVARKRIALTLRMDDPVGAKADRPQADRGPRFNDRQMTSRGPAKRDNGGGALAEAMRRAMESAAGKRSNPTFLNKVRHEILISWPTDKECGQILSVSTRRPLSPQRQNSLPILSRSRFGPLRSRNAGCCAANGALVKAHEQSGRGAEA